MGYSGFLNITYWYVSLRKGTLGQCNESNFTFKIAGGKQPYMGEHLSPSGGRILKIFEGGEYFGKKILGGIDFSSSKGGIS